MKLYRLTLVCYCCGGRWRMFASAPSLDAKSWCLYCNVGNCSRVDQPGVPVTKQQCGEGRRGRRWDRPYPRFREHHPIAVAS